jgi:signal transduction histidine kinase
VSLRARIILLVLAVALVPLGLVGWWLTRTAARSGEALLRLRLDEALERAVADIGPRWVGQRSALLSIAEHETVQRALGPGGARPAVVPAGLQRLFDSLDPSIESAEVRDTTDRVVWTLARQVATPATSDQFGSALLPIRIDVFERESGARIGWLDVRLRLASILSARPSALFVGGAVLAVVDSHGASLVATPFDPKDLAAARFQWAGEAWLAERRSLAEPRLDLVAAAPLDPFTQPFEDAARRGLWLLLGAAATALVVATAITARMTRRLSRLAGAADAVAHGDLTKKVEATGGDEVARVAHAFNTMTESLGRTLGELSQRESLAAVGSFASELAHEIRNPLTSIRVDLQVVEEQLPGDSPLREIQRSALQEIERLDGTVSGVLQLARSGRIELTAIDLGEVITAAVRTARPELDRRRATLHREPGEPASVLGDASALRQLVLNLLLNAAQALGDGGVVTIGHRLDGEQAVISVADDGAGMTPDVLAKVREPFFSTRSEGSGLGLAVADRIAKAHGGSLDIESTPGVGTVVRVRVTRA